MDPAAFREEVLPQVVSMWQEQCFCQSPGFRKLVSFDFRDYTLAPTGLADAEVLIDEIVRQRFEALGEATEGPGEIVREYRCPQCDSRCRECFEEFSINFYRTVMRFDGPSAPLGNYLIGFYGLRSRDFQKIHDFLPAETTDEFLSQLRIDDQHVAGG